MLTKSFRKLKRFYLRIYKATNIHRPRPWFVLVWLIVANVVKCCWDDNMGTVRHISIRQRDSVNVVGRAGLYVLECCSICSWAMHWLKTLSAMCRLAVLFLTRIASRSSHQVQRHWRWWMTLHRLLFIHNLCATKLQLRRHTYERFDQRVTVDIGWFMISHRV